MSGRSSAALREVTQDQEAWTSVQGSNDEQQRTLRFWWMLELFSPQGVPRLTPRATRPRDRQVIAWKPGDRLPWEALPPPGRVGGTERTWQHTVYLGVYDLESTYESLHRVFGSDENAYDERPPGRSAGAGVLVDGEGQLLAESAILSSALWAVGRIETSGASDSGWADGFPDAATSFREAVDAHEGARRDASGGSAAPAQDGESLTALSRLAHELTGVVGRDDLATQAIIIQSVAVPLRRPEGAGDIDFLNSFFLDDLTAVGGALKEGHCGAALASYLTSDDVLDESARVDVMRSDEEVNSGVAIERLPRGRWPSNPEHSLSLRQQFAVNRALVDLSRGSGLMGVNGPPGTGKTTMLRDILAGNVVERARRLAAVERAKDAFISTPLTWSAGDGYPRKLWQLRPELTGYEMVVASANNAAVENVTTEIPVRKEIDARWRAEADYFADIAREVLAETDPRKDREDAIDAWGLVAARLGNKRNRGAFQSAFWFDKKDPSDKSTAQGAIPRMQTRLAQWRDGAIPHRTWREAREAFRSAEKRVNLLIAQRKRAQERLVRLPHAVDAERRRADAVARLRSDLGAAKDDLRVCQTASDAACQMSEHAATARERHVAEKPGLLEIIFTFGSALRDWRATLKPLDNALNAANAAQNLAQAQLSQGQERCAALGDGLASAGGEWAQAAETVADLRRGIAADEKLLGPGYPGEAWTGPARELRAPWLDVRLDEARSELFFAALTLHQDFFANTADEMLHGLRAALEIVVGGGPRGLEPHKRRAAWQLFFLVVPLVSTTFASLGRMFGDIGPESIGWLLIDEAGQASPQYAAGAIWRARRVVAVGDPLQLQPVVTIPRKVQRDIASAYGVSDTWIPPQASVQTLADRVSAYGTLLQQADRKVWVSAPLTVHRRCDDPMFTLCNEIAYGGIMVNGVKRELNNPEHPDLFDSEAGPLIVSSRWVDEPAPTPGTHLQENQIARLESALAYLAAKGVPASKVIAISPFRAVADRLAGLSASYPKLTAGTIHTAQGKEAPVVFLILGGDPSSPGAKAWAASSVNLVNVAASRASRRLFVIGDRDAWKRHDYFHDLAAFLSTGAAAEG